MLDLQQCLVTQADAKSPLYEVVQNSLLLTYSQTLYLPPFKMEIILN